MLAVKNIFCGKQTPGRPPSRPVRPKILHVRVATGAGGGPDKTIINSPAYLEPLGYDAFCAYLRPPGDLMFSQLLRRAAEKRVRLIDIHDSGPWDLRVVSRLVRICQNEKVDIWHGHDYKSNALGLVISRFWPMRLVSTVHGWVKHTRRTPLYYAIDRLCLKRYERIVCVSADLMQECLQARLNPDKCVLIENAVDTNDFRRTVSREEAKKVIGIPPTKFLIGAVGRLSQEKGFDLLIEAVKRVVSVGLDIQLIIVGDGDQEDRLKRQIVELGLQRHIQLWGFRANMAEIYQAMDLFALSSYREGLPNVVLEAMACAVPVVATKIAGIPCLIQHEVNGLLVDAGDADGLSTALLRAIEDHELRTALAMAGVRVIEERYTFERRMQKMARVYSELLQC